MCEINFIMNQYTYIMLLYKEDNVEKKSLYFLQ